MYAMRTYFLYILKETEDEEGEIMDDDNSEQSGQDPMIRRQRSSYKKHG